MLTLLTFHHLETIRQEKSRENSQAVERRPGQIQEGHDKAEDSTRQDTFAAALRPTTGHYYGCVIAMMWSWLRVAFFDCMITMMNRLWSV